MGARQSTVNKERERGDDLETQLINTKSELSETQKSLGHMQNAMLEASLANSNKLDSEQAGGRKKKRTKKIKKSKLKSKSKSKKIRINKKRKTRTKKR